MRALLTTASSRQNVRFVLGILFICLFSSWVRAGVDTTTINQWRQKTQYLLFRSNDSSFALGTQIIRHSKQLGYTKGVGWGYALIGTVYRNKGAFDSSLYYAQQALAIFDAQNQADGQANVYNLLALTYKRMGDAQKVKLLTHKAIQYSYLARDFAIKSRQYGELSRAYNTIGISYRDLKQFDSARVYYRRAIAVELQHQPSFSYLPVSYANYGQILMDADKRYDEAISYYKRAIPLYEKQGNWAGLEHVYRNLNVTFRLQKKYPQAIEAANESVAYGRAVNDPHRLFNSLQQSYLTYRAAGQYEQAIIHLEEWKQREDSLLSIEKTQTVAKLEAAYESEKKEARIRQLADEHRKNRQQMTILAVGILLLLILLGGLFGQYQILQQSRSKIRQQSDQMSLMMRELHHRVKNNLAIVSSLLRLQASQLSDERVAQAIRTGQQRVEAMSLIHQRLYQTETITTVNVRHYLTDLINSLVRAYGYNSDDIDLQLDIRREWLDVDVAVPLGLIVNELATNSFKHAFPQVNRPMLRLSLYEDNGLHLELQDNGPGISPGSWQESSEQSFGKQLVMSLCEQLTGVLQVKQQNGALFQMRFEESS
ncbi:sensor histidine kinase [Spirosoma montaniterrae]|uniref:histidine kinase n=1 Tax=Spirosoma montaniterrae TaxID=1178516 RepID=A0A1P9WRF0_9BACT|nr:histidine kinase dimerization/phosphoacceptor domain -containing protein [Spirosoma montaniterrae]AQG77947.1 hypothetical protein AWR27_00415 [Spirosoma montaniterrae]